MTDVMIDLETMGNGPTAAIIALGAVEFDPQEYSLGGSFYTTIDLQSSVACGGVMDASTVMWWMKQSDAARGAFSREGVTLNRALLQFSEWLGKRGKDVRVWGNGAAFDNVILASAYRSIGVAAPWEFWNDRCYRTVKNLRTDIRMERTGTHHNALADAESQARHLLAILKATRQPEGSTTMKGSDANSNH